METHEVSTNEDSSKYVSVACRDTHIVGVEAVEALALVRAGGAARAWRRRGAAARPPAREYHRRARMPAGRAPRARPALRTPPSPPRRAANTTLPPRPHSRIYKRNSTRAIRGRIQLFTRLSALTSYGALKRRVSLIRAPGLSGGARVSHATRTLLPNLKRLSQKYGA